MSVWQLREAIEQAIPVPAVIVIAVGLYFLMTWYDRRHPR